MSSPQFHQPRSFAVDVKGNLYGANQANHVIQKITNSGVTTIAEGYTQTVGKEDGPAQNASFSKNFVPQICALLISDHGHKLICQINLTAEDCTRSSHSESTPPRKDFVSLLDSDGVHDCEIKKSQIFAEELKDLINFDGNQNVLAENMIKHWSDASSDSHGKLDDMIQANFMGFDGEPTETTPEIGTLIGSSGLVRRR